MRALARIGAVEFGGLRAWASSCDVLDSCLTSPKSIRCSTIGPSASAGTKVSAPTSSTVPTSSATNSGVCVGSVPLEGGTNFLAASEPAIASTGTTSQ